MIRVEDTQGFKISGNTISSARVVSGPGAATDEYFDQFPDSSVQWPCSDYHLGASIEYKNQRQLANLRGISVAAVSKYLDSRNSTIHGNIIKNFESQFANEIVGVDISGVSEGVIVSHNNINLRDGVGKDPDDEYIGCRVRSYACQGDIVKIENVLAQEEYWEQSEVERKLQIGVVPDNHPIYLETQRAFSGCPYGN